MAQSPLGAQFHEEVALAVLLIKRLVQSGDVDEGFAYARKAGLIGPGEEQFMRLCIDLDKQLTAREITPAELSYEQADRLQRCIARIG